MNRKSLLPAVVVLAALSLNGCAVPNPIGMARGLTKSAFYTATGAVNILTGTAISTARGATRTAVKLAPYAASAAMFP